MTHHVDSGARRGDGRTLRPGTASPSTPSPSISPSYRTGTAEVYRAEHLAARPHKETSPVRAAEQSPFPR